MDAVGAVDASTKTTVVSGVGVTIPPEEPGERMARRKVRLRRGGEEVVVTVAAPAHMTWYVLRDRCRSMPDFFDLDGWSFGDR